MKHQSADDAVFWDRIAGMPAWEAEQELVMRREGVALQNAMLSMERAKLPKASRSHHDLGVAILENNAQLTPIGERLRYLRKLQDRWSWKNAVRDLFGQEAMLECIVYMEQQNSEQRDQRREWAGAARNHGAAA